MDWEVDENDRVVLIKEKTKNRILKNVIGLAGRSQFLHIHLDELGSAAWLEMDGQKNIAAIAQTLQQKYASRIEPAAARVAQFFAQLYRNRFVRLQKAAENGPTP